MFQDIRTRTLSAGDWERMRGNFEFTREETEEALGVWLADIDAVVREALADSCHAELVSVGEQPVFIWGICPNGNIWGFSDRSAEKYPLLMVRHGRRVVERCRKRFGSVFCWCDARYGRSLRWLQMIGFRGTGDEGVFERGGRTGLPACCLRTPGRLRRRVGGLLSALFILLGILLGGGESGGNALAAFGIDDLLILGVVSAVISASAATAQAFQQKRQDKANAKIAEANANAALRHAYNIDRQADQERLQLRLKALQKIGQTRAGTAASGFLLGSGTANSKEADIASAFDLDMRNLNYDIASRVWQQKMRSAEYRNQASAYRAGAKGFGRKVGFIWGKAALESAGALAGAGIAAKMGAGATGQAFGTAIGAAAGGGVGDVGAAWSGVSTYQSRTAETIAAGAQLLKDGKRQGGK